MPQEPKLSVKHMYLPQKLVIVLLQVINTSINMLTMVKHIKNGWYSSAHDVDNSIIDHKINIEFIMHSAIICLVLSILVFQS